MNTNKMNPEKQVRAIAEVAKIELTEDGCWYHGGRWQKFDPLNDLNAMHEAEKTMNEVPAEPGEDSDKARYRFTLCVVCLGAGGPITATAAQRAEAFLKTVGRWEVEG